MVYGKNVVNLPTEQDTETCGHDVHKLVAIPDTKGNACIQVLLTPILRQALVAMIAHAPIRSVRIFFL